MAETTEIAWCDATFNPWLGCANVSAGCGHCYARTWSKNRMGIDVWFDQPRQVTSPANWKKPLRWAKLAREGRLPNGDEIRDGHRPRVFCASMADVFEELPELEDPRRRLFDLIAETPELDWLILTKRPEAARDWMTSIARATLEGEVVYESRSIAPYPANVWLGVSIENARFTWRADILREIPAAVRFISAEPLLGSLYDGRRDEATAGAIDPAEDHRARREGSAGGGGQDQAHRRSRAPLDLTGIDWVIIGGESGPGARPFHLEHAREIIAACRLHRQEWSGGGSSGHSAPSVFVKQLGAKPIGKTYAMEMVGGAVAMRWSDVELKLADRKGGNPEEWPADLRIREFPRSAA